MTASVPALDALRRRRPRPSARHGLASLVIHGVVVAAALGAVFTEPETPDFVSYQIDLVSFGGDDAGELVIEAPSAPPPEETAPPVPEPEPESDPEPEPAEAPPPPRPAEAPRAEPTPPARTSQPQPSPTGTGESAEAMNVRIEGLRRDYPLYYNNIIVQIQRCFRWSGGGTPATEVYFVINADGSVSDLRFVRQSGNPAFDYEALGAVECAGQPGRFGPLPDDLPFDRLPIRFTFRPGNVTGIFR